MRYVITMVLLSMALAHIQTEIRYGRVQSKGVNLGGWLVGEHWMTWDSPMWSGVSDDLANRGEYQVVKQLGHNDADWRFQQHRDQWITEADIIEIANAGLNTVRVPVGYWIAEFDNTGGTDWQLFTRGGINYLDRLIKNWALSHNVAVLISIHAAKGSQNGNDHSAPPESGKSYWAHYPENVRNTVDLAVWLANRYRYEPAFLGIGLLNEPTLTTDEATLKQYYTTAMNEIRATGNDCVLTIAPLLQQNDPWHFQDFGGPPQYYQVWVEWHKYLIWGYEGKNDDYIMNQGINGIRDYINQWKGDWLFMGEWSVASDQAAEFRDDNKFKEYINRYIQTCNMMHSGWTYWTWKVSGDNLGYRQAWSLRNLIRAGLFRVQ